MKRWGWVVSLSICAAAGAAPANDEYRNPILFADYSDPDVIRVGNKYYMTASSFHFSPGLLVEGRASRLVLVHRGGRRGRLCGLRLDTRRRHLRAGLSDPPDLA